VRSTPDVARRAGYQGSWGLHLNRYSNVVSVGTKGFQIVQGYRIDISSLRWFINDDQRCGSKINTVMFRSENTDLISCDNKNSRSLQTTEF